MSEIKIKRKQYVVYIFLVLIVSLPLKSIAQMSRADSLSTYASQTIFGESSLKNKRVFYEIFPSSFSKLSSLYDYDEVLYHSTSLHLYVYFSILSDTNIVNKVEGIEKFICQIDSFEKVVDDLADFHVYANSYIHYFLGVDFISCKLSKTDAESIFKYLGMQQTRDSRYLLKKYKSNEKLKKYHKLINTFLE
jgi:hypothetical protein